jgi:hypothetical protein
MTEIITCSKCRRSLQVPEHYLGQTVECPECGHQFTAASSSVSSAPPSPAPSPQKRRQFQEDDRDDDDERRRRRRRFEEEDDDDDDYGPIRRDRENLPQNRGGLIMALGLVSLIGGWMFCLPVVVGPIAWFMAHQDLRAIRDGYMDPTNEGMVRTGHVCGIISTIFMVLGIGLIAFIVYADVHGF